VKKLHDTFVFEGFGVFGNWDRLVMDILFNLPFQLSLIVAVGIIVAVGVINRTGRAGYIFIVELARTCLPR
jgi:hypothetical protein